MKNFRLEIVTPESLVFSEDVESLVVPAAGGYLGVLAGHAPLLCALTPGEVTLRQGKGARRFAASGGYMEVTAEKTVVLADAAEDVGAIDVNRAREAEERARGHLKHRSKETDVERAQAALARAQNRLKVAGRNGDR